MFAGKTNWLHQFPNLIDCWRLTARRATVLSEIFSNRGKAVSLNISDTPLLARRERLWRIMRRVIPSCRLHSKVVSHVYLYGALPNIQAIKILRPLDSNWCRLRCEEPSVVIQCLRVIHLSVHPRDDTRMGVSIDERQKLFPLLLMTAFVKLTEINSVRATAKKSFQQKSFRHSLDNR